jgi:2-polyprenyl-3-methyl-5-hydroxy-6-metoxy-1,4-benzoquinol methylase
MSTAEASVKAQAHDRIYSAIARSPLFHRLLANVMGADFPTGSTQYSFVGLTALRWIADRLNAASPGHCIDVGCGDGSLTQWLCELSARPLTGMDVSAKAIELAVSRARDGCDFAVADFCRMPLPDGSVRVVTALDCVQHAPTPAHFAAELSRVCTPGASVLFTHWMPLLLADELADRDPLCSALRDHGFRVEEVLDIDPGLTRQFQVYALVHSNQEWVRRELGHELYESLMFEARHLHTRRGRVGHLAVRAHKQ